MTGERREWETICEDLPERQRFNNGFERCLELVRVYIDVYSGRREQTETEAKLEAEQERGTEIHKQVCEMISAQTGLTLEVEES